ncbi:MAG TPA: YciI family protein [Chitinophagaceae bacterium]
MNDYLLLMRLNTEFMQTPQSPEQMQEHMKMYHNWVGEIAAQNRLAGGKGLATEGKVIKSNNVVTDGPYAEIKESLAGFIVVRAKDLEEAASFAKKCPILRGEGNSVEVRQVTAVQNPNGK